MSYNAAGVLAHMASDGLQAWAIKHPERDHVLFRIARANNRWNLKSGRNINYRSFSPITATHRSAGVWALANLTTVTSERRVGSVLWRRCSMKTVTE